MERNSKLLAENQTALTTVVRQQIGVRRRLERHIDALNKLTHDIHKFSEGDGGLDTSMQKTLVAVLRTQRVLLDRKRARFSRNRLEIVAEMKELEGRAEHFSVPFGSGGTGGPDQTDPRRCPRSLSTGKSKAADC